MSASFRPLPIITATFTFTAPSLVHVHSFQESQKLLQLQAGEEKNNPYLLPVTIRPSTTTGARTGMGMGGDGASAGGGVDGGDRRHLPPGSPIATGRRPLSKGSRAGDRSGLGSRAWKKRWDEALSWEPTAGLPEKSELEEEAPAPAEEEGGKDDDTWGEVEAEPSLQFDSVTGEWVLPPDDNNAVEAPVVVVDPGPDPTGLLGTLMELPYPVIMQGEPTLSTSTNVGTILSRTPPLYHSTTTTSPP